MSTPDVRGLANAGLDAELAELQARAFAMYEAAADAAEGGEGDAAYARAEAETAPLIARARLLSDERVRRLRARARGWRIAAAVIATAGPLLVSWIALRA